MKKKIKILTLTLTTLTSLYFSALVFFPLPAQAQIAGQKGLLTGVSDQCYNQGNCTLCDFVGVINSVIDLVLGLLGSLALIAFIYGGFQMMFGGAKPDNIQKGRKTLEYAVIGIILVFFSFSLVNFLLNVIVSSNVGQVQYGNTVEIFFKDSWANVCENKVQ